MHLLYLPSPQGAEGALRTPPRARRRENLSFINIQTQKCDAHAVHKALEESLPNIWLTQDISNVRRFIC